MTINDIGNDSADKSWEVSCYDGAEKKWEHDEIRMSKGDMRILLKMFLCQNLSYCEIISSVTRTCPDLLEVRQEDNGDMWALNGSLHYTARIKR